MQSLPPRLRHLSLLIVWFILAIPRSTNAGTRLKPGTPFSDGMVVQRDRDVPVWGSADPNAAVEFHFADQTAKTTADKDGHWSATLKPLPPGGPYTATITAGPDTVELHDIQSGDVWLCAGQSNMQLGVGEDVDAPRLRAVAKKLPNLRLLSIPKSGADHPVYSVDTKWTSADSDALDHFSAVAFHMGLALSADPKLKGVPIGLIDSSFGGTAAEGWVPTANLPAMAKNEIAASMFNLPPGSLYNHMIASLGPMPLTGVVWYQGENNAGHPANYPKVMTALISSWRTQFKSDDLPFVIVQLPAFTDLYAGASFTWVRESQAELVRTVPHTGLVVSIDTTNGFNLHPTDKGDIGRRAALQARRLAYHEVDIIADGPTFDSATVAGDSIVVRFDNHRSSIVCQGKALHGFAVAGEDGVYHFADASIGLPDTVIVRCADVPRPMTVRYAWAAVPDANLFNEAGLPAGPFRTDHQPQKTSIEIKALTAPRHVATDLYDVIIDGNGNLISLAVDKIQFISNDLTNGGQANFPGVWGPRQLQQVTELTDRSIRYTDGTIAVTYEFAEEGMTIRIENKAMGPKDKASYQLRLAAGVTSKFGDAGYFLERDAARVSISCPKMRNRENMLELQIQPGESQTVSLKFRNTR